MATIGRPPKYTEAYCDKVMTGQEWYDRFAKGLEAYDWSFDERNAILVAARAALGEVK